MASYQQNMEVYSRENNFGSWEHCQLSISKFLQGELHGDNIRKMATLDELKSEGFNAAADKKILEKNLAALDALENRINNKSAESQDEIAELFRQAEQ